MSVRRFFRPTILALLLAASAGLAQEATRELPVVPDGLRVTLFAREPSIRNPAALAFDARGRLFVGQGPQYRSPKPDTPGDSVVLLLDTDGDGVADTAKTFADGLNNIQGLAWHGRDLWVGNSPDLTIVRDLDGDDVADEYVRVYTDLGNLEHANHGHTWAPDGKLYFSQGTSKGLTRPGRVAPKPFRDLWDVSAPPGTPDFPPPQTYRRADYRRMYQDPRDDWGREGGVLRCDDLGANLEIVSRGLRNAWDIALDSGFNWLATDNDQAEGDRIFMPFYNAHFGWGHAWSTHWTGRDHPPTAPVSGPVFDGSGTGLVYYDFPQLPPAYRGVWLINDWLRKTTYLYRPVWDGALLQPAGGRWQPLVRGGGAARAVSAYGASERETATPGDPGALYKPVDVAIGPDGALYVSGWGEELGVVWRDGQQANEGRIFRISWPEAPPARWLGPKRDKPLAQWTPGELLDDLGSPLPVWNIDAQDELVRRGAAAKAAVLERLVTADLTSAQETWTLWTLGRMEPEDRSIDAWLAAEATKHSLNRRIQSIRIAAHRIREHRRTDRLPAFVVDALRDPEPRIRFAAVQSIAQARQYHLAAELADAAGRETDRVTYYATWQALREVAGTTALQKLLADDRAPVRRAALLALAESRQLDRATVQPLVGDRDPATAELAANWLAKQDGNPLIDIFPKPGVFIDSVTVKLTPGIKPASVRHTLDGSEPTMQSRSGHPGRIAETTTLKAALFVDGRQVGNTITGVYRKQESGLKLPTLAEVSEPTTASQVMALLPRADAGKGKGLYLAAGCAACHRIGAEGLAVGPDLSAIGERDDPDSVIRSILTPNQIVVEGYSLLTVSTRDGKGFAGIFEQETDRTLRLVQLNGEPVSIEKSHISSRQSIHQSPMPPFDRVFSPAQLADLVAWLMQQRGAPAVAAVVPDGVSSNAAPGNSSLTATLESDRVVLSEAGRAMGEYVFRDPHILRPHFRNLHAPSGVRLTRNQPLQEGDATDHATMHPGVWLAFGSVNGQDFWRNKGRIEHVRFSQEPSAQESGIRFATENRLIGADGVPVASLEARFAWERSGDHAYLLTIDATLRSAGGELVFGDQEEMGLGVRVATALTEKSGGLVVNSDGLRGAKAAWGKPAAWAMYSRLYDGRHRGVAIFPAAVNPTPAWWHSRDYGVIVANGFGARVLPAEAGGRLVVQAGDALRLRYGVALFDAPADASFDPATIHSQFQRSAAGR